MLVMYCRQLYVSRYIVYIYSLQSLLNRGNKITSILQADNDNAYEESLKIQASLQQYQYNLLYELREIRK